MFLSMYEFASHTAARRLLAGMLAVFLTTFTTALWAGGSVLFEDHFDDGSSLENWEISGKARIEAQMFRIFACTKMSETPPFPYEIDPFCSPFDRIWDSYGLLKKDPERNFEFWVKLQPTLEPQGRIILQATDYSSAFLGTESGFAYVLTFDSSAFEPGIPKPFDLVKLTRLNADPHLIPFGSRPRDEVAPTIAEARFSPTTQPSVRIVVNGGNLQVFVDGKRVISYTDPAPLPPGRIGLGITSWFSPMRFDDAVVTALTDLRCSTDPSVDGKDPMCAGGLLENKLWAYLGPDGGKIAQVDFYLDGRFRRSEFYPPWELDGGSASRLTAGAHEIKAKVRYKDGTRTRFVAGFEVGEHSLRCSPDRVLDGNDAACEGNSFDAPTWVYWWPETGVKSVDYYVNGVFHRTDGVPPFELDGGAASSLIPLIYNADNPSQIRSVVHFKDGRQPFSTQAKTTLRQDGPASLLCSGDEILDGFDDSCAWIWFGSARAYLWPEEGIRQVDYYVDGTFHRTERYAPFELDGGAWTDLPAGVHGIAAIVRYVDESIPATAITTQVYAPD